MYRTPILSEEAAGPQDLVLRFDDGKLVAANSGKQGGGQN
jgi:hypothetical protein